MSDELLSPSTLLHLWHRARAEAGRACAHTLARLRAGEGGFYTDDDFYQDLFLEFRSLALSWAREGAVSEETLWAAWRARLERGGKHILRRRPQRLWQRPERATDPAAFALDGAPTGPAASPLPPAAREALSTTEDGASALRRLATLDALEQTLWSLPPTHRQVLFMVALEELPAAAIAHRLGLSAAAAAGLIRRARRAFRRVLARAYPGLVPRPEPQPKELPHDP